MSTDQSATYSPSYGLPFPSFGQNGSGAAHSPGGGSLGQKATRAIQAVVPGFGSSDPKAFADSLKRSFKVESRPDGRQFSVWAPASLGGSSNPAELTGAVADFYLHASAKLTQARAELLKLEPLCEADHHECCDDIREIIKLKLDELENAFKATGGPDESWITDIFAALLGSESGEDDDGDATGLVARLADQFTQREDGEEGEAPVQYCEAEERRCARIRIFGGSLASLQLEWNTFAENFLGDTQAATQVVGRLRTRLCIVGHAVGAIRHGLRMAGYLDAHLEVEEFAKNGRRSRATKFERDERNALAQKIADEAEESCQDIMEKAHASGSPERIGEAGAEVVSIRKAAGELIARLRSKDFAAAGAPERLKVGCALARIEHFALQSAPEILQRAGQSAFAALESDALQLRQLACLLRHWLLSKLKLERETKGDGCVAPGDFSGAIGGAQAAPFLEHTGEIGLVFHGSLAAARTLFEQLSAFHREVSKLRSPGDAAIL